MRTSPRLFRAATSLAVGSMVISQIAMPVAYAQSPPPGTLPPPTAPGPQISGAQIPGTQIPGAQSPGPQNPQAADPPARVGRIAQIDGTVSFHTADQTQWEPASLNYPLTSGNSFWTEPKADAGLEVGGTRIVLNEQTEFDVGTLNSQTLVATLPQGEVYLHIAAVADGEVYRIATPRGEVAITMAGRYGIIAGNTQDPTTVTVIEGAAHVGGGSITLDVGPGQTAVISGVDQLQSNVGTAQISPFVRAQLDREQAPPTTAQAQTQTQLPVAVTSMTGCSDLAGIGQWTPTPEYGQVWYPPVKRDWVPYREGHWAWVAPWGWTWVDNASWGFAPSHYGRWVQIDNRWGWTPVDVGAPINVRPVYAPALVSFVGLAAGVAIGAAIGASVGWIPLGPREPYYPPYRVSPGYFRNVNVTSVRNVTNITNITNNRTTINNYVNRGGATFVSPAVMTASQPVGQHVARIAPEQFAAARPLAEPAVRPTYATVGVTPAVARSLNIQGQPPARAAAPGPAMRPREPFPGAGRPGALGVTNASVPAGVPPLERPGAPPAGLGRPGNPAAPAPGASVPTAPLAEPARPGPLAAPGPALARPDGRPGEPARPGGGLPQLATPRAGGAPPVTAGAAPGPAVAPANRAPGAEAHLPEIRQPGARPPEARAPVTAAIPGGPEAARPPQVNAPSNARPGEPPRIEAPRAEPGRAEQPRAEPPRADLPRTEPPRTEPPRTEPPHASAPRAEPPRIEAAPRPAPAPPHAAPPRPPQPARDENIHPTTAAPAPRAAPPPQHVAAAAPPPRPAAPPPRPAAPPPRPAPAPPHPVAAAAPRPAPPPPHKDKEPPHA